MSFAFMEFIDQSKSKMEKKFCKTVRSCLSIVLSLKRNDPLLAPAWLLMNSFLIGEPSSGMRSQLRCRETSLVGLSDNTLTLNVLAIGKCNGRDWNSMLSWQFIMSSCASQSNTHVGRNALQLVLLPLSFKH